MAQLQNQAEKLAVKTDMQASAWACMLRGLCYAVKGVQGLAMV